MSDQKPDNEFFINLKNPNNGLFEVIYSELIEKTTLEIYNINGTKIYSEILLPQTSQHTVDILGSPSGIYLIVFSNSKEYTTTKMIIDQN